MFVIYYQKAFVSFLISVSKVEVQRVRYFGEAKFLSAKWFKAFSPPIFSSLFVYIFLLDIIFAIISSQIIKETKKLVVHLIYGKGVYLRRELAE